MEEAPENGKKSSHSAHQWNEWMKSQLTTEAIWKEKIYKMEIRVENKQNRNDL